MPSSRMSSFSTTRRLAVLRGMIEICTRCRPSSSNAKRSSTTSGFGHVAVAGVLLVDPVADVRALERAALHRRQVDLAGEVAVDEDAEAVAGAELALALAGAAAHGERVRVLDDVGLAGDARRLPLR